MGILIKQDDGQLIPYAEVNHGWSDPKYSKKTTNSLVIDRNGSVVGIVDSESGKPIPMSNIVADAAQNMISDNLYGLKRGNPDLFNPTDQLRVHRSVDRNPQNPYAVGSRYSPDEPLPDQPPQYGDPYLRRPGWGLVEENPQPQAPADVTDAVMKALKADGNTSFANWRQSLVNQGWDGDPSKIKYDPSTGKFMSNGGGQAFKGTGKPRKVRQGRSSGNLSRSGGNTYATAGIPKGGVVSPATMMRTSGVPPVQVGYGMNVPIGEGEPDYTLTYDPKTSSMKPNDPYYYYDPSRNDGNEFTYDPITHQLVRR